MRNKNKQKCRELYTIEFLFTTPCAHTQKKQCRIDTAEEKEPCKQGKTARLWGGRGSCSTPIRTGTERTKNSSAAITPWNIHKRAFLLFAVQKYDKFSEQPNFGA